MSTFSASSSKHCSTFSRVLALHSKNRHPSSFARVIPSSLLTTRSVSWNDSIVGKKYFDSKRKRAMEVELNWKLLKGKHSNRIDNHWEQSEIASGHNRIKQTLTIVLPAETNLMQNQTNVYFIVVLVVCLWYKCRLPWNYFASMKGNINGQTAREKELTLSTLFPTSILMQSSWVEYNSSSFAHTSDKFVNVSLLVTS